MPTTITVRRNFSVQSLLDIEDPEFAHWYGLGVFWAMYGDQQGNGLYCDAYIIDTIQHGVSSGWYGDRMSSWFAHVGFYLGMLHGGMLDPVTGLLRPSETLVVLTDPDFTKGYHVGRDYCFTEALLEGRHLSDQLFNEAVHTWALDYATWHESDKTLRYCLGCRIGELSGALLPLSVDELISDGTVVSGQVVRL